MDLAAIIDHAIARCREFITLRRVRLRQIARPDRRLAVAARDIQHIFRLAQAERAASEHSRGWLACTATQVVAPRTLSAATISGLTRVGSATGTRVWMRMILT